MAPVLLLGLCVCTAHAASELSRCRMVESGAGEIVGFETITADGSRAPISGLLVTPSAAPPYPAVILLHRYFGIETPDCFAGEMARYRDLGYAVLLVDSNSAPPAVRTSTSGETPTGYGFLDQAGDALGAVAYLSSRPAVARDRIFLVGHAYGGSAVLRAVSRPAMAPRLPAGQAALQTALAGAVAWHPACPRRLGAIVVPLLVITGAKDSLNSSHACAAMTTEVAAGVAEPRHLVFRDAGHNFDMDWFTAYDAQATREAYLEVAGFLDRLR